MRSLKAEGFIRELLVICELYDMSLGHEDPQGSFLIFQGNVDRDWLKEAREVEENDRT